MPATMRLTLTDPHRVLVDCLIEEIPQTGEPSRWAVSPASDDRAVSACFTLPAGTSDRPRAVAAAVLHRIAERTRP